MASVDYRVDPDHDERDLSFQPADPAAATTLTAAQVERYNAEGYVSGLRVFDDASIAEVRRYVEGIVEQVVAADDLRNRYSVNAYQMVCQGIYDLVVAPRIIDLVQDIVGPDIVCWGSHLFFKMAGDPMAVPMHQDAIYWPMTPTKTVTAWLALDDADEENAAMGFVPASHLLGPLPHEERPLDGSRVLKRAAVDPEQYGDVVVNRLRAGELSLHNDLLLHGSGPNTSTRRRAGMTLRYASADVRTVPGYESWTIPAVHCRGDVDDFWPHGDRPDGDHPERMAGFAGEFDGTPLPDAG